MKFLGEGTRSKQDKENGESTLKKTDKNLQEIVSVGLVPPEEVPKITVDSYLKAGYSLIYIRTDEDHRAVSMVKAAIESIESMYGTVTFGEWRSTTGLILAPTGLLEIPANARPQSGTEDIVSALRYIQSQRDPHVIIYHNLRQFIPTPGVIQQLKDASFHSRLVGSHIIIVGASLEPPPELQNLMTVYDMELPSQEKFAATFRTLAGAYQKSLKSKITTRDIEMCSAAAVGMTELQGENAIALSIAMKHELSPTIIQLEKEQAIKRNDVLEFVHVKESMSHLGGFKALKDWVAKRQDAFTPEAREYGLKFPKGILLVGIPGCICHESIITIRRGDRVGGRTYSIQDAFYKFHNIPRGQKDGNPRSGPNYFWDRKIPTYMLAHIEGENRVGFHEVDDIIHSGFKFTYTITTESGKQLRTTKDHKFSVPDGTLGADSDGCKRLGSLEVGDSILVRATKANKNSNSTTRNNTTRPTKSVKHHPYARVKIINDKKYLEVGVHRLTVEALLNNKSLDDFLAILRSDSIPEGLIFLDPKEYEVHHIDQDTLNNDPDNLLVVTNKEHLEIHGIAGNPLNFWNQKFSSEKVVSIDPYGVEEVFDVVMKDPYRIFIANDFLVHNSGKSLSARCISQYLGIPLLKFDMGKVFRSLVGSSENAARTALRTAEAVAPVVLWIEEIEKSMAGSQSSGNSDSGTTARVMSTILTWMQENKKPVFIVATANNVTSLPPELLRKGRFSEIWGVIEPNSEEREEIWKIHIGLVRPDRVGEFDLKRLVEASEGYTGAEIEGVVEEAMFDAWSDDHREMTSEDLLNSIKQVVPQSKMSKENVDAIRDWMTKRARFVSGYSPHRGDTKDLEGTTSPTWRKIHTANEPSPAPKITDGGKTIN